MAGLDPRLLGEGSEWYQRTADGKMAEGPGARAAPGHGAAQSLNVMVIFYICL